MAYNTETTMVAARLMPSHHARNIQRELVGTPVIVVALAGADETADEATVKRFFRENGRIRLQPENDALEPIYTDYVEVLGKVTGVFRSL